jgi:type IV pilus assembly protein PilB
MMKEAVAPKPLIGDLLVQEGLISKDQLKDAIAYQKEKKIYVPLGEIFVEKRFLSRPELQSILKKHKKRLYLGELLVNLGHLTQDEVEKALQLQKIEKKKLGAVLIENGYLTEANLLNILSTQLGIPKILPTPGLIDPALLKGVNKAFLLKHECLPAFRDGDVITVIMSDPLSEETIRILEGVLKGKVAPAIAGAEEIQTGIKRVYDDLRMLDISATKTTDKETAGHLVIGESGALENVDRSIIELLNFIISSAIAERATDIHIEPMENMLRVRYRIDGLLKHKTDLPAFLGATLVSRIKAISRMEIDQLRKHQDGRLAVEAFNRRYDLRVATYASFHGESLSLRILPNQSNLMDLEMIGFSPSNLRIFKQILNFPSGIAMITGPAGTGKSTTVYAALRYLNSADRKILTVEDPIEYKIDGIIQGQINEKAGMNYKNFLRSLLRQDPDVIMVGEIRDKPSAEAVIEMALSGHKVITTFHTEDAVGALLRIFGIGVESFLISSTIMSVVAQRLLRVLCPICKTRQNPPDELLVAFESITPIEIAAHEFHAPTGCPKCDNTGYKGRTSISEILVINDPIRDAIINKSPYPVIRTVARESTGFVSLKEDGFYKATTGVTSLEEVLRVVPYNETDAQLARSSTEIVQLCEKGYAAN